MNEELRIIIKAVTSEAQKNLEAVKKGLKEIEGAGKQSGKTMETAMAAMGKSAKVAIGSIVALTTALVALGKSTMEFRKTQAQLVAGFQSMGLSAAQAASTYEELYGFLGERDTAVEAANQLAQLTQSEKELAEWTNILMGVYAKFPSSLPVESLAEAANETAKTGKVTGALADALNWAGASEEAFQAQLDGMNSVAEREAYIRSTLNSIYSSSASLYKQNNKALIEYNKSQVALDNALAEATKYVTPLMTSLNSLGATLLTYLSPAIHTVSVYLTAFIQLMAEAIEWTASFFGLLSGSVSTAPAANIAGYQKAMEEYLESVRNAESGTKDYSETLDKLKKQTMGFDELNVVGNPSASSDGTGNEDKGNLPKPPNAADFGLGADAMAARQEEFNKRLEEAKKVLKPILGLVAAIALAINGWKLYVFITDVVESIKLLNKFKTIDIISQVVPEKALPATLTKIAGIKKAIVGAIGGITQYFAAVKTAIPEVGLFAAMFPKLSAAIASATDAVAAFVGTLSAGTIAIVLAIIVAIASAVYFLWKNWDSVTQAVKNFFAENIGPKLENIKKLFAEVIPPGVIKFFKDAWQWIKNICIAIGEWFASIDWLKGIGVVFEWLGGIIVGIVGGVIMGAISALMTAIEGMVKQFNGIVKIVTGIVQAIVKLFSGDLQGAWDAVKMIGDGIVNVFVGLYDMSIGVIVDFVKGIIDWFVEMWDVLVGHSIVPDMVKAIIDWFLKLPKQLFSMISNFVKTIIDHFKNLASNAGTVFSNMVANIKKPFQNIASWFKDVFSKAWKGVKDVFSSGGVIFDGIKSGISGVFTTVVNGLITGINKVIAVPFNSINSILNGIRNINVAGITPFSGLWGHNPLAVPQIPKLATGGLVDGATLAMIGERGREAVLPLENNTGWMDMLADRIAARSSAPSKIVLQVGERELGYATINSINGITRQTGVLQLVMP